MELQGERLIPADLQQTWDALNDPQVLKDCIAGCESLERTGDNSYEAVVAVKVGPVAARFKGKLLMSKVQPPRAYTIQFDGQGGAAGFGKGSADVSLAQEGDATRLRYNARAQVGGKMAQIGSRLIDATAAKMTEDFFNRFEQRLKPAAAAAAVVAAGPAATATTPAGVRRWGWLLAALIVAVVVAYFALNWTP